MKSHFFLFFFLTLAGSSFGQTPVPVSDVVHPRSAPNLGKVWKEISVFAQDETKSPDEEALEKQFRTANFQGKAWLVDFQDGVNRVLSSENGGDWTLVSNDVEFGHLPNDPQKADTTNTFWSIEKGIPVSKVVKVGNLPNDPQEDNASYLEPKALFVFSGKLWLLGRRHWVDVTVTRDSRSGGRYSAKSRKGFDWDEIWNSSDGVHWALITDRADYYPNQYFQRILVNDNGMFMITNSGYQTQTQIWSSVNGDHWTKVGNVPFDNNLGNYWTGTFLGKLWIMGGVVCNEDSQHVNHWTRWRSIWSSTDGVHWEREKDMLPFDPCISPNWDNQLAVLGNRVYALDGQSLPSGGDPESDQLWSSLDGVHWEEVNTDIAFKTIEDLAVLGNQFVMNYSDHGFENEDSAYWTSPDGVHWVLHTNDKTLVWREHGSSIGLGSWSVLIHQGKLWVFDVMRDPWGSRRDLGELWRSNDGESWEEVNNSTPRGLFLGIPLSFQDKLWVINDAIFSSEDGVVWEQKEPLYTNTTSEDVPVKLYYPEDQAVVMDSRIFLLSYINHKQSLWVSADGIHWDLANGALPMAIRKNTIFQVFNHKLWIIGGEAFDPDADDGDGDGESIIQRLSDIWCSPDGVKWTKVEGKAPFDPMEGDQNMIVGDRLFLVAGKDHSQLWVTPNGKKWTLVSKYPAFPKRNDAACVSFNEKLWMFGGHDVQNYSKPFDSIWCTP